MKRFVGLMLLLIAMALTSACAEEDPDTSSGKPATGGDVPVTSRALAAIAAEHTGEPSSATTDYDAAEEFKPKGVGAELRFGADGEYDGDMVVLAVGKGLPKNLSGCSKTPAYLSGCAETDGGGTLLWEKQTPEEDPGVVYLTVPKGDATVLMFYSGPDITGDPRDLDLPIDIDDLLAIASDPRVDLTTSQDAIDAGDDLGFWKD